MGPGVLDNNGEAEGQIDSTIVSNGKAEGFEDGKYYVVIAGANADEAALRTHFAVEGSKAFVKSLKGRIVETTGTRIYRAEVIPR